MAKVVGYHRSVFDFNDKRTGSPIHVEGYTIYTASDITANGSGIRVDKDFISDAKLMGYIPTVGDNVEYLFNRYRKVDSVRVVSE